MEARFYQYAKNEVNTTNGIL